MAHGPDARQRWCDGLGRRQVERRPLHATAPEPACLGDRRLDVGGVLAGEDDVVAPGREMLADLEADRARPAHDHDRSVVHHRSSSLCLVVRLSDVAV